MAPDRTRGLPQSISSPTARRTGARSAAPTSSSVGPVGSVEQQRAASQAARSRQPEAEAERGRSRERVSHRRLPLLAPQPESLFGLGLSGVPHLPLPEPTIAYGVDPTRRPAWAEAPQPARQRRRLEDGRQAAHFAAPVEFPIPPRHPYHLARSGWSPESLQVAFGTGVTLSEEYVSLSEAAERERRDEAAEMQRRQAEAAAQHPSLDEQEQNHTHWAQIRPYRPWEADDAADGSR